MLQLRFSIAKEVVFLLVGLACLFGGNLSARAAVVFGGSSANPLANKFRWNAASTTFLTSSGLVERSLVGGLRFSLAGGSYESYRDQFTWSVLPSASDFEAAVNNAFTPWTATDPVTGLGTQLSFVPDLSVATSTAIEQGVRLGAEIDLLAGNLGSGTRGEAFFNANFIGGLTLTSGTSGYAGAAITGADITMNNNNVAWDLNTFQTILTHEIGHAIGLGDVEDFFNNGFIDDNYSALDPLGTLTNSWAGLVNPLDPANSEALFVFQVPNSVNGIDAPGVDILMESNIPGTFFVNGAALQNDDFGGRQFLYPQLIIAIPEASSLVILGNIGVAGLLFRRRKAD